MRTLLLTLLVATVTGCSDSGGDNKAAAMGGSDTSGGSKSDAGSGTGGKPTGSAGTGGTTSMSMGGKNENTNGGVTMNGTGMIECGPGKTPGGVEKLSTTEFTDLSPTKAGLDAMGDDHVFTQGIAVDPSNPGTVYITISGYNSANFVEIPGGLCKSTDGGNTWTTVGKFQQPLNIRVDPKDPKHMYVGDGVRGDTMGFWVTTDGGETWTSPKGFVDVANSFHSTDVYHIEPNPEDFNHVLVSFHGAWNDCKDFGFGDCTSGIIESFDGGANWTVHDPEPGWAGKGGYDVYMLYAPDLKIGDAKTWLVGSQGAGYWRTTDAGGSWKQVTTVSMSHGGAQLYRTKTGDLFLAAELTPLMSKDNGATWTELNDKNGIPSGYYYSLFGDGTNMYTSSNGTDNKFITAAESDPLKWHPFNMQAFGAGVYEQALDEQNAVLYTSNWNSGVLALKAAPQ